MAVFVHIESVWKEVVPVASFKTVSHRLSGEIKKCYENHSEDHEYLGLF